MAVDADEAVGKARAGSQVEMIFSPGGFRSALFIFCFAFVCFHNPGRRTLEAGRGGPRLQRCRDQDP